MTTETRIVALDPTSHGYGFVVFEGPARLIDWGHTQVRPTKRKACMESIAALFGWYDPAVVVLEDWFSPSSRRSKRVKNLLSEVVEFVIESRSGIEAYSTLEVARCFAPYGQITKHEIAETIAEAYPELASRLPPKRKIWMSEDERSSIFDAAGLALAYFFHQREEES